MRIRLIVYWVTTALIALETFAGGIVDLTHGRTNVISGPLVVDIVTGLGYPVYILTILGIWKLGGAVTLILPGLPRLKEWAYAGIIFELTGAIASWIAIHDNTGQFAAPLILAVLAIASWALRPPNRTFGAIVGPRQADAQL
jgi:hypothetical protein